MRNMIRVAGAALFALAGCIDNPITHSSDNVVAGSPQSLQTLASGALGQTRNAAGVVVTTYFSFGAIQARDALRLDPNDNRLTQEFFVTTPDPSSFIGAADWARTYVALRAITPDVAIHGAGAPPTSL